VKSGDKFCVEAFERISRLNAAGIATVIHYYNPEIVVLGGAIALNNFDLLLNFRKYLSTYLMDKFRVPEFRRTTFGDNSVIVGAAALVVKPPKTLLRLLGEE
jgi:glucokinase